MMVKKSIFNIKESGGLMVGAEADNLKKYKIEDMSCWYGISCPETDPGSGSRIFLNEPFSVEIDFSSSYWTHI